jgi:Family of unknown function (DUF6444)
VLAALVVSLRSELAQARAELERARERIAELEARLTQSPRNSSRPPSSEGLAKLGLRVIERGRTPRSWVGERWCAASGRGRCAAGRGDWRLA